MLEKLMEYQRVDKELKALDDALRSSEDFKKYSQARKFLKTVAETKDQIDDKAKSLIALCAQLEAAYATLLEEEAEFKDVGEGKDLTTVSYIKKKAHELSVKLANLENEIAKLNADLGELTVQYKKLVKQNNLMKEQRDESREKYEALVKEQEAERAAIEKRLAEIAKDIPEEYMNRYLEKRKDNKFPICYEIEIGGKGSVHCTACGTEFSSLQLSKLKQDGFIECENCRKLIFVRKKD